MKYEYRIELISLYLTRGARSIIWLVVSFKGSNIWSWKNATHNRTLSVIAVVIVEHTFHIVAVSQVVYANISGES